MKILVTGAAGFIGYHVSRALLEVGFDVFGIDNLNAYYDVQLKQARLAQLQPYANFCFEKLDIANAEAVSSVFSSFKPDCVIHLAAQAGVRYSLDNPQAYLQANLVGFGNMLECCRQHTVKHCIFASSSSVYGLNSKQPFQESDNTDHPVSLYGATKKANEVMAHSYADLYNLPLTGLRFFTVYGPWGRPDMAPFKFTQKILTGESIDVYNHGQLSRDFTYIDDITQAIVALVEIPAQPEASFDSIAPQPHISRAPYRIYNIGNNQAVQLLDFITCLETALGVEAKKNFCAMQPGDAVSTLANCDKLAELTGLRPNTPLAQGINAFVDWYKQYYRTQAH